MRRLFNIETYEAAMFWIGFVVLVIGRSYYWLMCSGHETSIHRTENWYNLRGPWLRHELALHYGVMTVKEFRRYHGLLEEENR